MKDKVIVRRLLPVPAAEVWAAITDKEQMRKWYFDLAEFEPRKGFSFRFSGGPEEGPVYIHLCEVTEVIPQSKLTYSWKYDDLPGISHVTWQLEPQGENTLLTLTHTGLDTIAPSGPNFAVSNFEEGWDYFINKALPEFLEAVGKSV